MDIIIKSERQYNRIAMVFLETDLGSDRAWHVSMVNQMDVMESVIFRIDAWRQSILIVIIHVIGLSPNRPRNMISTIWLNPKNLSRAKQHGFDGLLQNFVSMDVSMIFSFLPLHENAAYPPMQQ